MAPTDPPPPDTRRSTRIAGRTALLRLRAEKIAFSLWHRSTRRSFLRHRIAPSLELRRLLPPGVVTVLDVGANRGQFVLLSRWRYPDATIHAFEAQPNLGGPLRSVGRGDPRLTIHMTALGRTAGTLTMNISEQDDSSSLLEIGPRQTAEFPHTQRVSQISVSVERLDAILSAEEIDRPCMAKLDVQGFELEVLAGAEGLLPAIDWLLVECSYVELYKGQPLADEIIEWLRHRGFRVQRTGAPWRSADGSALQADLLFARDASAI